MSEGRRRDKSVFLFFFRREHLNWLECKLCLRFTCAGIMLNSLYTHTIFLLYFSFKLEVLDIVTHVCPLRVRCKDG